MTSAVSSYDRCRPVFKEFKKIETIINKQIALLAGSKRRNRELAQPIYYSIAYDGQCNENKREKFQKEQTNFPNP